MTAPPPSIPLRFAEPVTLVGGGLLSRARLDEARSLAAHLIAADGAGDLLVSWGLMPAAVIGDMDSVADPFEWAARETAFLQISEQDSTDFEKCLYATEAPFYIAAGFAGGRADHMLAVFHTMLALPDKRVVVLGEHDAIALIPPRHALEVAVTPGVRVSLFPLRPVTCLRSAGLHWPVDGMEMAPGVQSGTSNRAAGPQIMVETAEAGLLILLPPDHVNALVAALSAIWSGADAAARPA